MPAAEAVQIPAIGRFLHPGGRPGLGAGHARCDIERGPDGIVACQILLLPGFELNELSALTEAFDCANRVLCEAQFDWHLASLDGAPVRSASGLTVSVTRSAQAADHRHLFVLSAY